MDSYTREDDIPDVLTMIEHGLNWLLAVLPDDLRPSYTSRYYELVERYAPSDEDRRMVTGWLNAATSVPKHN
jgi:hypothetical protein